MGKVYPIDKANDTEGSIHIRFPKSLKICFWLSIAIGVAMVLRRIVALSAPIGRNSPPQLAALDAYFSSHATLTYIHILCALAFVLSLPLLFWQRTRDSHFVVQTFFFLGLLVGGTAYAMSVHAVGGWLERSAILIFNTLFLASLARAMLYARHRDHERRQRWMLRAIAIALGIATARPVMGIFFATSPLTGLTPPQFFGMAIWIGFLINTTVIEFWLRHNRRLGEKNPAEE